MKSNRYFLILLACTVTALTSCKKDNPGDQYKDQVEVLLQDIPYKTESYLRIPYTLKMREYEKEGMVLEKITALNKETLSELMTIEKADLPFIYKDPLPVNPYFTYDKITSYYISLQLPVPLTQVPPENVIHRFEFIDTVHSETVVFDGASFSPRLSEVPVAIASPVKGKNWVFINQSTNAYHFYTLFFMNGKMSRPERFAFDNIKFNDELTTYFDGDPQKNESYFNYRDTLFAVADGTIVLIQDGKAENHGDAHDVTFGAALDLAGNYLILDIGGGRYAYYCHCVPYSFLVNVNQTVKEGDPIALLGNSGNSDAPHLHFQLCDGTDFFSSNSMPFVLKSFIKTADLSDLPIFLTPAQYTNSMMEQYSVIKF